MSRGIGAVAAAALMIAFSAPLAGANVERGPAGALTGPDSSLPIPRYVSLAVDDANGRHGPGLDHKVDWIYERAGLPLRVTGESGPWRRVMDPDGAEVWMHQQNLKARRTVYVASENDAPLRSAPRASAKPAAFLAHGVTGALTACRGDWRRITVGARVGWVKAQALWAADDCTGL